MISITGLKKVACVLMQQRQKRNYQNSTVLKIEISDIIHISACFPLRIEHVTWQQGGGGLQTMKLFIENLILLFRAK